MTSVTAQHESLLHSSESLESPRSLLLHAGSFSLARRGHHRHRRDRHHRRRDRHHHRCRDGGRRSGALPRARHRRPCRADAATGRGLFRTFFGPFSDLFRTFFGPLGPDLGDVLRVELSDLCVVDQALLKGGGDNGGGRSRKGSGRSGGGSGRPRKGSEN